MLNIFLFSFLMNYLKGTEHFKIKKINIIWLFQVVSHPSPNHSNITSLHSTPRTVGILHIGMTVDKWSAKIIDFLLRSLSWFSYKNICHLIIRIKYFSQVWELSFETQACAIYFCLLNIPKELFYMVFYSIYNEDIFNKTIEWSKINWKREAKANSIWCSQAVSHPSTNQTQRSLTFNNNNTIEKQKTS